MRCRCVRAFSAHPFFPPEPGIDTITHVGKVKIMKAGPPDHVRPHTTSDYFLGRPRQQIPIGELRGFLKYVAVLFRTHYQTYNNVALIPNCHFQTIGTLTECGRISNLSPIIRIVQMLPRAANKEP